jgi:hypothetical protein
MTPIGIIEALFLMFATILVPGFLISRLVIKGVGVVERLIFSISFGLIPMYVVYLLVKNDVFVFSKGLVIICVLISLVTVFTDARIRKRIVGWWFTD